MDKTTARDAMRITFTPSDAADFNRIIGSVAWEFLKTMQSEERDGDIRVRLEIWKEDGA